IWSSVSFILLLLLLKKFAWRPIIQALQAREEMIEGSIADAQKARKEVDELSILRKSMLEDAKRERVALLKEAQELKMQIIDEAKKIARNESDLMLKEARIQIQQEKANALREIKNQVAILSVDIAGVLLKSELEASPKQQALIENYLKDVTFN
ncbi:MAG: F0F1 ATP synthase subunit B, partial [Breznakibacter sp.]|nr:F0F1 ATP synthase subunit B [Breznakibacter sp.]